MNDRGSEAGEYFKKKKKKSILSERTHKHFTHTHTHKHARPLSMTSWTGVGEVTPIVAVLDNRWEENLSAETRGEEGKSLFKGW